MRFTRSQSSTSLLTDTAAFGLSCSFTTSCAWSYDRSAVRPTTFSFHQPRMDIHSISCSSSPSCPLSISLCIYFSLSSFYDVSPWSISASLHRSLYAFAIRVFQPSIYAWRNVIQWIYPGKESARRWRSRVHVRLVHSAACLRDNRYLHHANWEFRWHTRMYVYFLWYIYFIYLFPVAICYYSSGRALSFI